MPALNEVETDLVTTRACNDGWSRVELILKGEGGWQCWIVRSCYSKEQVDTMAGLVVFRQVRVVKDVNLHHIRVYFALLSHRSL